MPVSPVAAQDVRVAPWLRALRDLLRTSARLVNVLGGDPLRIVTVTEKEPKLPLATPGGRLVLVGITTPLATPPDEPRLVAFLVRTEFTRFDDPRYDVAVDIDVAHEEAHAMMQNYTVPAQPGYFTQTIPTWREREPQASPTYDDSRAMWMTSAEYRAYLAPNPV